MDDNSCVVENGKQQFFIQFFVVVHRFCHVMECLECSLLEKIRSVCHRLKKCLFSEFYVLKVFALDLKVNHINDLFHIWA